MWLFYFFSFERNYDILKSKSPWILLNKNINFVKNEMESKMENPTHSFRETNLAIYSYKNCKLKVKLWWIGALKRKKRTFFVTFILSEVNFVFYDFLFFKICVLCQCIVYWIHLQNIHTFTYQKIYFIQVCCLFLKSLKAFRVSLIHCGTYWNKDSAFSCRFLEICITFFYHHTLNV